MKYLVISLLIFISDSPVFSQGIQFDTTSGSWGAILRQAKEKDKPIFVDVFTTWCGPCKLMDKTVFNQPQVGSFYNQRFIAVKVDAEKGFGIEFAKVNKINAYPTFLYFSSKGELLLSTTSYKTESAFLTIGNNALKNLQSGVTLEGLNAKMKSGKMPASSILLYIKQLSGYQAPNSSLIEQYLTALPEDSLFTPATMKLVSMGYFGRMPINGKAYKVLLHAYNKYPVKNGELMSPWNTLRSRLLNYVDSAGILQDEAWLEEILQANEQLFTNQWEKNREKHYLLCRYYAKAKDSTRFFTSAGELISKHIMETNPDELYLLDTKQLREALQIRYGTTDEAKLKNFEDYEKFIRSNLSYSQIITTELLEIAFLGRQNFKQIIVKKEAIESCLSLYKNNPVYVNAYTVKNFENLLK